MPGVHIPIYDPDHVKETKPDYVLILAWNLKEEIIKQMSYIRSWGGNLLCRFRKCGYVPNRALMRCPRVRERWVPRNLKGLVYVKSSDPTVFLADGFGKDMHQFIAELYPICRSITGEGIRETFRSIQRHIPLNIFDLRQVARRYLIGLFPVSGTFKTHM